MGLQLCRVVLVGTHAAGNLGATARIMTNMGLRDLVLVAPRADPRSAEARQMATHGEGVLAAARVVNDFDAAVADCAFAVGTSARPGSLMRRQTVGAPEAVLAEVLDVLEQGSRAALVFGPEPTGLSNEILTRCQYLVHIPTDDAAPSLNLAQAVAICLYELRRLHQARTPPAPPDHGATLAPLEMQERMFQHLRLALEEIHFLYGARADTLMHALRHVLGRSQLSVTEVKILFGMARQLRWIAAQTKPAGNEERE